MSLGLSHVTQVWASALSELQQPPADKLGVLLRVCGGEDGHSGALRPKDAGAVVDARISTCAVQLRSVSTPPLHLGEIVQHDEPCDLQTQHTGWAVV